MFGLRQVFARRALNTSTLLRYATPNSATGPTTSKVSSPATSPVNTTTAEVPLDDNSDDIPGFRAPGQIPTNYEIAIGKERYEHLSKLKGTEPWFDMSPIVLNERGTKEKPITLTGIDPVYYVGCSGKLFSCFFFFETHLNDRISGWIA